MAEISIQDLLTSARTGVPLAPEQRAPIQQTIKNLFSPDTLKNVAPFIGMKEDPRGGLTPMEFKPEDLLPLILFGGMAKGPIKGKNVIDFSKALKARAKQSQKARAAKVAKDPPLFTKKTIEDLREPLKQLKQQADEIRTSKGFPVDKPIFTEKLNLHSDLFDLGAARVFGFKPETDSISDLIKKIKLKKLDRLTPDESDAFTKVLTNVHDNFADVTKSSKNKIFDIAQKLDRLRADRKFRGGTVRDTANPVAQGEVSKELEPTLGQTFNAPPKQPDPSIASAFGPIIKPLPDDAKKAFATVTDTQRGAPEIAMTELVRKGGGSELNGAFEHIGDLTHVLTNEAQYGSFRRERVLSKIRNHIGVLENPNTPKFLEGNFESNAKFAGIPLTIQKSAFARLTRRYADEHRKIPVFNRPQKLARDAAVALGEGKYKKSAELLRKLEKIAEDPGTFQQAAAAFKKGK